MVKNIQNSIILVLIIISFNNCKKENNSIHLTAVFDWEKTNYYGKIINEDTVGKAYVIEFNNNTVKFYENDNLVLEGKLIGKSNSFSCHDHGTNCISTDKYTILIENELFEIKKRTYDFYVYDYDNNGIKYSEFYSGNFPFEAAKYYPYSIISNKFIKRQ